MGDYNGEIMSEVMAQRQPLKPTYTIPIIPIANSSQFKHQEVMDVKEFKVHKVTSVFWIIVPDFTINVRVNENTPYTKSDLSDMTNML